MHLGKYKAENRESLQTGSIAVGLPPHAVGLLLPSNGPMKIFGEI
jgi:hypothetical protein